VIDPLVQLGAGRVRLRRLARVAACAVALLAMSGEAHAQIEDVGVWVGAFANGALPPALNNDRSA
jgi:hypothetical protein